jgi:serine/threonine-protein kinase
VAPDGLPVFIRLTAAFIADVKHAEAVLRFLGRYRELNHRSLIKVLDSWVEGGERGYLGLVTEFVDGGCLRDRLRQQGPVAGRDLVSLFMPLADATDFLHRHGVRHGNIKPENLLLGRDVPQLDVPRLPCGENVLTITPMYSAPEACQRQENPLGDQYSLAVSYGELRLDRPLFPGLPVGALSVIRAQWEREPDLEPLPQAERQVLRQALAKDPGQRYPDCRTFVEELDRALARRKGSGHG